MSDLTSSLDMALVPQVRLAADGDIEAFSRLVETTSSTVCGIAFAITRDVPASEDITQDVFLSVWKGLGKLKNPQSFLPWLRQLTRNQANSWLRRRYSERVHQHVSEAVLTTVSDPRRPIDLSLEENEDLRLVIETLEALPDAIREVLVLYYREERSTAQVARLLGLSQQAVRKRLQRARQNLRQDVARRVSRGLAQTSPGAALVTVIVGAVSAAPAPAGATVLSAAAERSATTGTLKLFPWAATLGALTGVFSGAVGVVLGSRGAMANALDDHERQQLRRFRTVGILTVIAAGLCFVWSARFAHWLPPTAVYLAFVTTLYVMCFHWLPRITARRLTYELSTDPQAASRQRRQRHWAIVGFVVGVIAGAAGVCLGLGSSGLLPWQTP